jgi:hypothetical protein
MFCIRWGQDIKSGALSYSQSRRPTPWKRVLPQFLSFFDTTLSEICRKSEGSNFSSAQCSVKLSRPQMQKRGAFFNYSDDIYDFNKGKRTLLNFADAQP